MDLKVTSSVWNYAFKEHDLFIDKFLELLLKYEYAWCEQDERKFRISLTDDVIASFAEDFREFQVAITAFDIAYQMREIRKIYNKTLLELEKNGKSENIGELPWFTKAHKLFSAKTDRGKDKQEDTSLSSDKLYKTSNSLKSQNFQEESIKVPSLSTTWTFSKTDKVTTMPNMSSVTANSTCSSVESVKPMNGSSKHVRQQLKGETNIRCASLALKKANCCTSKASIVKSPFNTTTLKFRLNTPSTPVSAASRIPCIRTSKSSAIKAPLLNTPSMGHSSIKGTSMSSKLRIPFSSRTPSGTKTGAPPSSVAIPSRIRVPSKKIAQSLTGTPCKTQVPKPTTNVLSRAKGSIFKNIKSEAVEPRNKSHSLAVSSLSFSTSSPSCRFPSTSVSSVSRSRLFSKPNRPPRSYSQVVPPSSVASTRIPVLHNNLPSVCNTGAPPSVAIPSKIRAPSKKIGKSRPCVLAPRAESAVPSNDCTTILSTCQGVLEPSSEGDFTTPLPTSCNSILVPGAPVSSEGDSTRAFVSSSQGVLASNTTSSKGDFALAPPNSCHEVLNSGALTSKDAITILPYNPPPPCSEVPISTVESSSRDSFALSFLSSTVTVASAVSFSSSELPLSPPIPCLETEAFSTTTSRSKVPISPIDFPTGGVPFSSNLSSSPTRTLTPAPDLPPLKLFFSPRKSS